MTSVGKLSETIAQGPPDLHRLARLKNCQKASELANDVVDNIDADGLSAFVEDGVVEREGPPQEGIASPGQPQHDKLPREDSAREGWAFQADAPGPLGEPDVLPNDGTGL